MLAHKARIAVIALSFVALPATQSDACEFLRRCFGGQTSYRPTYAPTCCPQPVCCQQPVCCPQPTVSYMPQTCYRTVYQSVPVVAYRPTTSCDPCTGCPRTVMQPVTSYVSQARLVPYTSYRAVTTANYAQPCGGGCGSAATTAAYPSVAAYQTYAAAAPACCPPAAPSAYAAPGAVGSSVTTLAPSPSYPAPTVPVQPAPGVPATSQPTFEPAPQPESRMMQPLQLNPSTSLGVPRALDPESQDRMTKSPVRQAFAARLVSTDSSITRYEDDGWRAAE